MTLQMSRGLQMGAASIDGLLARIAELEAKSAPFLPGQFQVATLPPASENVGAFAWVTDLHDGSPDRVVSAGGAWKPVRPLAVRTVANANQNMTLIPLVNAPTQFLKGVLTVGRSLTLGTQYAYPGARFRIKREATGLFALSILGSVTGLVMGANTWADYEFDGTMWVQTAAGGLL